MEVFAALYCFRSFTVAIILSLMIKAIVLLGFFFFVLGGPECVVIHVLSWVSTTFLIDLITFPMTESKIKTTSELTVAGSVFDVPVASLVAQQDICTHGVFFSMVGLHLGHKQQTLDLYLCSLNWLMRLLGKS